MDTAGIDISGLKEMEAALTDLAKEIGAKKATGMFTSALNEGAKEYEEHIKANVNVSKYTRTVKTKSGNRVEIRPGFLKSRIKRKASTNRKGGINKRFGKNEVSRVKVGAFKVPYIVQYEFGTSRQQANPDIRNAFKSKTTAAVARAKAQLKKKIMLAQKRIAKKRAAQ
jgi:hypothetical protein